MHAVEEAHYFEKLDNDAVRCVLCPRDCTIQEGGRGFCRARENQGGVLYARTYGLIASAAMDPIEKKPLYHFHPGTEILSLGGNGCNFACRFCQNYEISQGDVRLSQMSPEQAVAAAADHGSVGIAYTYNEPLIWYEYVSDTARLAQQAGLKNVLVTNGYINQEPLEELLPLIDALNIDIKSMDPDFYKNLCAGALEPVLETAKAAKNAAHVEITNLIIPGHNDTDQLFERLAGWVADELGEDTPLHLSAYFPRYKLQASPTPAGTLERAFEICHTRLPYVFLGNVASREGNHTHCRACGALLVRRSGYSTQLVHLEGGSCEKCGQRSDIVC